MIITGIIYVLCGIAIGILICYAFNLNKNN